MYDVFDGMMCLQDDLSINQICNSFNQFRIILWKCNGLASAKIADRKLICRDDHNDSGRNSQSTHQGIGNNIT